MGNIKIDNLSFSYGTHNVLTGVNFHLFSGKSLSIIGHGGCGKTTLLKILNGDLKYEGTLEIEGTISVVFRDTKFKNKKVIDEIKYYFDEFAKSYSDIEEFKEEIKLYFGMDKIFEKDINSLDKKDKSLLRIILGSIANDDYIAIDDLFIDLDYKTKILLLNFLESHDITLINVTSDMEDVLYTDCLLCLYNGKSAIDGETLSVLENEKIIKRLGFNLPLMYDLSIQLGLYGLIDKIYLNKEEMVKNLWK